MRASTARSSQNCASTGITSVAPSVTILQQQRVSGSPSFISDCTAASRDWDSTPVVAIDSCRGIDEEHCHHQTKNKTRANSHLFVQTGRRPPAGHINRCTAASDHVHYGLCLFLSFDHPSIVCEQVANAGGNGVLNYWRKTLEISRSYSGPYDR